MSPPHPTVAHDCRRGKRRKERRRPSSGWLPNGDGLFGSFAQRRKRAGISMRRRRVSGCTVAGTAALESWVNFIRCLCPKLISNQNRVELCGICSKRALCCMLCCLRIRSTNSNKERDRDAQRGTPPSYNKVIYAEETFRGVTPGPSDSPRPPYVALSSLCVTFTYYYRPHRLA